MPHALMSRIYTWEVVIPASTDHLEAVSRAQEAAERVTRYNPHVLGAAAMPTDAGMVVKIHFQGRDQWWIKKMIVHPIVAVLAQARIPFNAAKLISLGPPEDLRSTRKRASDGRHNPIPEDQDIDHCDMMECENT